MLAPTRLLPLFAALSLSGCGAAPNRLSGSVADVYNLDFDTVAASLVGNFLVVEYLRGTGGAKTVKLSVDLSGLAPQPAQPIDLTLTVPASGSRRGTLQRIIDMTVELPLRSGTLTLDQVPIANARLAGHLRTTLSDPAGRTLNGDFEAPLVQK